MAMVVKNNMSAVNTLNVLDKNSNALAKSLAKVSSGMKINGAADDASGFAISERMRVQMRSLEQDVQNAQNGISMLKTAEGAVSSTVEIVKTLKEKAINAANDSNTDADRATIQKEVDQYANQIDDNALVTYNGRYLLNKPYTEGASSDEQEVEKFIVKGLNSEWLKKSMDLIQSSYNLAFGTNASVNEIEVKFEDENTSTLAYVTNSYNTSTGVTSKLSLTINMNYNKNMSLTDENGLTNHAGAGYLDRTIAHEMTHALMAANIKHFNALPLYVKEGAAELVHGIDDERKYAISQINASNFQTKLDSGSGEDPYAAGYVLLRYMAKQGASAHGGSALASIQAFMSTLDSAANASTALDAAVSAATGGTYATMSALRNQAQADFNNAGNVTNFLSTYCDIDLTNADTGSITGLDAGGSTAKTAESVVPESTQPSVWTSPSGKTTIIDNLKITWPDLEEEGEAKGEFLNFQIGTKANQVIRTHLFDMRSTALGLRANDGTVLQMTTREKASAAMAMLDEALDFALDVQTTLGALQSRLEYTVNNLVLSEENVQSSESTIRDADMAKEMTEYTKNNVLMQSAQSMLAQANQSSSSVLSLLQ